MRKWKRMRGISLLMAAAVALSGCGGERDGSDAVQAETQETAAIAVKAINTTRGTLTISNEFVGTVSPQQQVSVIPMVSGEVDAVYFEVGDEVQAGDVLFHIDDEAARLQEESARLQRQSIDATAKAQLGAGQVMNNISMQSNIKSIQFQIDSLKDQYQASVDGVVDARQAKTDMEDALNQINASIGNMQSEQEKRQNVISEAQQYAWSGTWEEAYTWSKTPDQYEWYEPAAENPAAENPSEKSSASESFSESISESERPSEGNSDAEGQSSEAESEPDSSGGDSQNEDKDTGETNILSTTDTVPVGTDANAPAAAGLDDETEETIKATDTLREAGAAGIGAYFSVEVVTLTEPVYLAASMEEIEIGKVPDRRTTTLDRAWEAYNRQQKINAAKANAESMGYSASDLAVGGSASQEMTEMAAEIVALEYQASQIQSSLASMDSTIRQAESAAKTTQKTIDFYEENLNDAQMTSGIQSGQVYEDTAYTLATQQQAADVAIKSAQMQLEFYSPKAPISGTVISKAVEVYGMTQPGYAAYVISNQDAMKVTFLVSGQVKENLTVGMPVTLKKSGTEYPGTIAEIGAAVEQQSGGLFLVTAMIEAGGDDLASGTAAKVVVDTFKTENAILIPYDAVHFESEQAYVFVIQDGILVRTPVTLGLMNEDTVEVTEGLVENNQVVSTWSSQLEEGAAVRVIGEAKE